MRGVSVLTSALIENQRWRPRSYASTLSRARTKAPVASESKMGEHTSDSSTNDWVERYCTHMKTPIYLVMAMEQWVQQQRCQ